MDTKAVRNWFRGLRFVWFLSLMFAIALLVAIEKPFFSCHPHWQLLLREIAFALLLSSIFGSTIEEIQRKEFIRLVGQERDELKRDVFLYAYGFYLPDQIREEISSSVMNSKFYRENLVLDWEFSAPGDDQLALLKKQFSYTLVNNSSEKQDWKFTFNQIGTDDAVGINESIFHILKIRRTDGEIEQRLTKDMKEEKYPNQPHWRKFCTSIELSGREKVEILYEITQKRRLCGDDQFSLKDMTVGTTHIRLRFPEKPEFQVTVSCKQKQLRRAPDEDPPRIYSFELNEGLFPHQAIVISWSAKAQQKLDVGKS